MGLDLVTRPTRESIRVGTYRGVHAFRHLAVRAFRAAFPEEAKETDEWLDEASEDVRRPFIFTSLPNYEAMPDTPRGNWSRPLIGLWKFVYHSDCDGFHSAGDVADVAAFFQACPQLAEIDRDDYQGWYDRIADFFRRAAERGDSIFYA